MHPGICRAMEGESAATVTFAFFANLLIALVKLAAAILTRSSALFAEAAHAFADTGNGSILILADRRGDRPPDEGHPLGHGREAYFWALLASVGVFITGGLLSIGEGVHALLHPEVIRSFALAYGVLATSLIVESASLWKVHRQLRAEADTLRRELLDHVNVTSDPVTRAVFAEDVVAVSGNLVAIAGVALHQVTGSPVPDAGAAIVIGLGLTVVAYLLASRNRRFLIGEQAPQPLRERLGSELLVVPGIDAIEELVVTFVGPRQVQVLARVDVDDTLSGGEVEELVRRSEIALRGASDAVTRVDVVPRGPTAAG
jgi:cation diffusion facilitator family transporter